MAHEASWSIHGRFSQVRYLSLPYQHFSSYDMLEYNFLYQLSISIYLLEKMGAVEQGTFPLLVSQ